MTDHDILSKRAVLCAEWQWMPGMEWWNERISGDVGRISDELDRIPYGALPRLDDPATIGCLLALVRGAYGVQAHVEFTGHLKRPWRVSLGTLHEEQPSCESEAEALIAALELAR